MVVDGNVIGCMGIGSGDITGNCTGLAEPMTMFCAGDCKAVVLACVVIFCALSMGINKVFGSVLVTPFSVILSTTSVNGALIARLVVNTIWPPLLLVGTNLIWISASFDKPSWRYTSAWATLTEKVLGLISLTLILAFKGWFCWVCT